ncbi:MAG: class I SAM-dependent methyltransferase [Sphingobacteriales bacterium]|nr:class I SAM-dependent methyltransferase [Sphingobacteriales bacterium]
MKAQEIKSYFNKKYNLNEEQKLYLEIHAKRFETILALIPPKKDLKILDIGPSYLSELLFDQFGEQLNLIGFDSKNSLGGHLASDTIFKKVQIQVQDLNFWDSKNSTTLYDVIICAEVMEHLYTSPHKLFQNLNQILNKEGLLIMQTPNAAALRKRLRLLFGKNPYEIPRENLQNPGHFREFTLAELKQIGTQQNFSIEKVITDEYFEYPSHLSKTYRRFKKLIPFNWRSGISIVFKKR